MYERVDKPSCPGKLAKNLLVSGEPHRLSVDDLGIWLRRCDKLISEKENATERIPKVSTGASIPVKPCLVNRSHQALKQGTWLRAPQSVQVEVGQS